MRRRVKKTVSRKSPSGSARRKPTKRLKKFKQEVAPIRNTAPHPPAAAEYPAEDRRLPAFYGEDRLALLVRDPWWIFAYWEITPQLADRCIRQIDKQRLTGRKTVLRVYDVTGVVLPKFHSFFDIELNVPADNWYIDVGRPDREWTAEIGFRTDGGKFFPLVRSNRVRTPAFGISEVLDEEWMLPEDVYYRLIGRSLGSESRGGSQDIRRLLEKYLKSVVSSERLPELYKAAEKKGVGAVTG